MNQDMISTSSKFFELMTNHIQNCDKDNCCVKELAFKLIDDKMGLVTDPQTAKEILPSSNQRDYTIDIQ